MLIQNEKDLLGIEEFTDELLYNVSVKIVSNTYIEKNQEFMRAFIYDLFLKYLEGVQIKVLSEIVESVFYNMFYFKPMQDNLEEEVYFG